MQQNVPTIQLYFLSIEKISPWHPLNNQILKNIFIFAEVDPFICILIYFNFFGINWVVKETRKAKRSLLLVELDVYGKHLNNITLSLHSAESVSDKKVFQK